PGAAGSAGSPALGPKSDPQCTQLHPGTSPVRRLTREEYDNTVLDVLGDDTAPGEAFPPDGAANGFHNAATQSTVSQLAVDKLQEAAEKISARALKNERSRVLGGCDPAKDKDGEDACVTSFLGKTGRRLFRRPLTADEDKALRAVITWGRQERGYDRAIELGLQVMLQHPSFLYRLELTPDAAPTGTKGVVKLSGYELASRLAFLLWSAGPDDALLDQARDGKLDTPEQVRTTAEAMLQDDRARRTLRSFHDQWLEIGEVDYAERNDKMFPQYSKELVTSMHEETSRFVEALFFEGDRKLSTLMSARWSYVDADLAKLYGVTPPPSGFAKVDLGPTKQRAGVLTHASVMTSHAKYDRSAPVLRGRFVRQRLLCVAIPDPDMNVMGLFPDIDPTNLTTRQYFEEHVKNPVCAGCHDLMDPIGFGFENYDAVGAWRTTEKKQPIDSSGSLSGAGSVDGDYNGAVELADKLAG
ncbi:MAG: DUF1592 domain-containing protein, partial [Myxococcales bacterium]